MLGLHIQPHQNPSIDPRLIEANLIIRYSTLELEQAISRELDENPALELVEPVPCPLCARPMYGNRCISCSSGNSAERVGGDSEDRVEDSFSGTFLSDTEDDFDAFEVVAAPLTLPECLLAQLRLHLDEQGQEIALHIVGDLNEHGYFISSPEELAQTLQVEVSSVQWVLDELQDLDPPGIGARTVEECLLLQLRRLERQEVTIPFATRDIIQDHLKALGRHHFEHIRRALTISREDVEIAFLFIRTNLHPYPAYHYYGQSGDPQSVSLAVQPSILIQPRPTEPHSYEVEVVEPHRFQVRVHPLYLQPYPAASNGEREHVTRFLERAQFFIGALQRRHHVLEQLVTYLVIVQRDFIERGPRYLHPLTQTSVAKALGIHASMVSRATAGKFVQLPSQVLLPLQRFFAVETCVQDLVRQMILQETSPLSDEQLARRLREEHSISVSRQMIANHRVNLKIPTARQRILLRGRKRNVE